MGDYDWIAEHEAEGGFVEMQLDAKPPEGVKLMASKEKERTFFVEIDMGGSYIPPVTLEFGNTPNVIYREHTLPSMAPAKEVQIHYDEMGSEASPMSMLYRIAGHPEFANCIRNAAYKDGDPKDCFRKAFGK
jgi:hypothetical protein